MARPKKQTVDYFPHNCTQGKTMFILEQKYSNDGYAFWFKLLEILGSTEGHCLHFINGMDWEFLIAKTKLDKEKCTEILELLATLGAIDKDLWSENIVWSDNFIEGIKDAYRNRIVDMPVKPSFLRKKSTSKKINSVINPHTILKETKVNKSIYAEFVSMTPEEYQKLIDKYGETNTKRFIEKLNVAKGSKGYKYKSDYLAILNWVVEAVLGNDKKKEIEQRIKDNKKEWDNTKEKYTDVIPDIINDGILKILK